MPSIKHKLALSCPPTVTFRAITQELNAWWARDAQALPAVGQLQRMQTGSRRAPEELALRVLHLSPGEVVAWRVERSPNPATHGTTLSMTVRRHMGGSTLTVVQEGFREDTSPGFARAQQAWKKRLASLRAFLEQGAGQPG